MRRFSATTFLTVLLFHCFGQSDTTLKKQQKGFLFLSAHNYMYDYKGEEIKRLGFHDFFFPYVDYDSVVRSRDLVVITDGIRLDFFKERMGLKSKAKKIFGKDTVGCYGFDSFYVLPVIVNYKEYKDYEPSICKKHYYIIKTEGKEVWFAYFPTAATITKVTVLPNKKAKSQHRSR